MYRSILYQFNLVCYVLIQFVLLSFVPGQFELVHFVMVQFALVHFVLVFVDPGNIIAKLRAGLLAISHAYIAL
jgi:hypothetical protein